MFSLIENEIGSMVYFPHKGGHSFHNECQELSRTKSLTNTAYYSMIATRPTTAAASNGFSVELWTCDKSVEASTRAQLYMLKPLSYIRGLQTTACGPDAAIGGFLVRPTETVLYTGKIM